MSFISRFGVSVITFGTGLFLGIAFYFSDNVNLQPYFWFPILFGFVAIGLALLEIKQSSQRGQSDEKGK